MNYSLNKSVVLQEAENISLPENIIAQISDYVDRLYADGHEIFFARIMEDFFNCGKLLDAPEMPDVLLKFPEKELLFLVAALASVPLARERFTEKGLPLEQLDEGVADIRIWSLDCLKNYGIPGLEWGHGLHWIFWRILTGQVLRFGRLECNKGFSFPDVIVLKNRRSGKLQAVYNCDAAFDADGFVTTDASRIVRHGEKAKKLFSEIAALPMRPDGSAAEKTETFFPDDWEGFLAPGDNVLSLHIPADGRLDVDECRASLRRMKEFYGSKGYRFKAFVCSSWFLDANMKNFAGSRSNMVQFQDLGVLIAPAGTSTDVVYRVFGSAGVDGSKEYKSQLQRNLAGFLTAGGIFRGGRIVIDPQDI